MTYKKKLIKTVRMKKNTRKSAYSYSFEKQKKDETGERKKRKNN